ncbi:uncharacterized protein LOC118465542 [Anopheles albimanus]|uniref:Uncharacterized protein n=1 Tax=Anopheles albimanus TaxID=7167 RepID=A0A182FG65_ANOAL|nr:uncharacterized protein LOC118465542 [Anopheles albimanus]
MYLARWTSPSAALSLGVWLAFCVALLQGAKSTKEEEKAAASFGDCSPQAVGGVKVKDCCRTYLDIHLAIIDCLPRANQTGAPCVAQCVLQRYRGRNIINEGPITLSTLLTLGPKLTSSFDTCKQDIYEFLMNGSFEGDFRQVMCNERLDRFLDCMVKSWYTNCLGYSDDIPECGQALTYTQNTNCTFASLFLA